MGEADPAQNVRPAGLSPRCTRWADVMGHRLDPDSGPNPLTGRGRRAIATQTSFNRGFVRCWLATGRLSRPAPPAQWARCRQIRGGPRARSTLAPRTLTALWKAVPPAISGQLCDGFARPGVRIRRGKSAGQRVWGKRGAKFSTSAIRGMGHRRTPSHVVQTSISCPPRRQRSRVPAWIARPAHARMVCFRGPRTKDGPLPVHPA